MHTNLIQLESELRGLAAQWAALRPALPMMSPTWMLCWWESYQQQAGTNTDSSLFVVTLRDDENKLIALAPWYVSRGRGERKVLRFLGSGPVCSDHLTILCQPHRIQEVVRNIVLFLHESSIQSLWNECDFDGVDEDDPVMQALAKAFQVEDDTLVSVRRATSTWQMKLPETWDEYLSDFSKNRRKRIRRLQRMYLDSGRTEYRVLQHAHDFDVFFDSLVNLHNLRRNSLGEAGVFECPLFLNFHHRVMQDLLAAGNLHCSLLYLDGEPVAAEYLLKQGNSLFAYQSGLDPAIMEHSPGTVSLLATLRYAMESGVRNFDFLRGNEDYKTNWAATARAAIRIRIRKRSLLGYVQHLIDQCKDTLKKYRESSTALPVAD